MTHPLDPIFHPRSIAVAGASADPSKSGHQFFSHQVNQGFAGDLYPVNPRGEDVLGYRGYKSLDDIPGHVDYVISSVPAEASLDLIDQAGRKGTRAVQFFTARFSETGDDEKAALERTLAARAKAAGVRILGPNCMGIYHPKQGMAFWRSPKEPGNAAVLAQSGGNMLELLHVTSERGLRFSKVVSYGNATDVNEADLVEYFGQDAETAVIGAYIEGARDGRRFARALAEAVRRKPVVLWKGGRTRAGQRAAASHTASLAGSNEIWRALARQTGAVLVDSLDDLGDMLLAFANSPPTAGRRVGVVSGGGGRMVESADACEDAGLIVEPVPEAVRQDYRAKFPEVADWISNPADMSILGGSDLDQAAIFEMFAASSEYDLLLANLPGPWLLDDRRSDADVMASIDHLIETAKRSGKPTAFVVADAVSSGRREIGMTLRIRNCVAEAKMPVYPSIRRAAQSLSRLAAFYANNRPLA